MTQGYDRVSKLLHWLVAGLVLVQFSTGWVWDNFERGSVPRFYLFRTHIFAGYGILAFAVLRILWRLRHPAPALPAGLSRLTVVLAKSTHGLLYLAILVQPMLGILTISAYGRSLGWPGPVHVALAFAIAGLVGLHVAAALWHQFVRRDGLLRRMLPVAAGGWRS